MLFELLALVAAGLFSGAAAYITGAVVPFTYLGIMPTNHRLEEPTRIAETAETESLLRRWGALHAGRTAASLLAFGVLAAHALGLV